MNISFKSLQHLGLRKTQKDGGISLARTTRAWLVLFLGVLVLLAGGAVFAAYMFVLGTDTARIIITNPVDTVHYQSADIKVALVRYDALRARFGIPVLVSTGTQDAPMVSSSSSAGTVATSTPVRVE